MQHAEGDHGAVMLGIDHDVIAPDNHLARAGDAPWSVESRTGGQLGNLGFDLVLEPLSRLGILIGYVVDDRQQIGPRVRAPLNRASGHGACGRSALAPLP